jgi:SAM-dependent methyltransferase
MDRRLVPGAHVRHPGAPDWGLGQVQSAIGDHVTVNFEHAGKQVINAHVVTLAVVRDIPGAPSRDEEAWSMTAIGGHRPPTDPSRAKAYLERFERPTAVFDGLSDAYDRYRPDYPAPVVESWLRHLDRGAKRAGPRFVVDLASGTGISTRALARALDPGDVLIAAEPGEGMRSAFAANPGNRRASLLGARGERLPFGAGTLDAIVIAQAAHWMDRAALLAEARHALAPGGTLAFLTNNRYWEGSRFLDAYEGVLDRLSPGYRRDYRSLDYAAVLREARAVDILIRNHHWNRPFDAGGFLGLVRSTSMYKNAVEAHGAAAVEAEVRALVAAHADTAGNIVVAYETELVAGRLA